MSSNKLWNIVFLAGAVVAGSSQAAHAQDTNATLSGSVVDTSKAVIPGATVTLVNEATKAVASATTGSAGEYNFPNLRPGKYILTVAMTGFKTEKRVGLELDTAQQAHADVALNLGDSQQTVEVQAEASTINYTDPTLGGTIAPETLQDFPLVVSGAPRSSVSVATMMPGVSTGGGGNAFNARINGGIVSGDEAVVDGATAMEGYMNQSGMVALQTDFGMSPDITSEVTVLSANYDAQYGNTTSGQLIINTKSGGEKYHGAVYEYLRNDLFNASTYGLPVGTRKPEDHQNDYGAALGGQLPFLNHKFNFVKGYFYFNYEGFKEVGGANPATLSIASLADRAGNFSKIGSQLYYPNDTAKYGADAGQPIAYLGTANQINPAYEDPVAKAWLAALPTPTSSAETNNYFIPKAGQGSLTNSENVYFGRFDFNVGPRDHVYYTSWWQRTGVNTQTNLPVPVSTANPADPENAQIQRLNWEHNFSATLTNHATFGYLNRNEGYYALNGSSNLPTVGGVANTTYKPQFNFGDGYSQLGSNTAPDSSATKTTRGTYAFNDVLTKVLGHHTIKAGFEYRLAGTAIHTANNQGGTFTFNADTTGNAACGACPGNSYASFYLGAVSNANVEYFNSHAEYPRQPAYAVHLGDSWRATKKLTLDYSLRWDYISPSREKYDHLSFFDPNGSNPGAVTAGGTQLKGRLAFAGNGYGSASYGADYPETPFHEAFAPRLGFAYALSEKTVVRAGYGIYFGQAFYPGWAGGLSQDGFNKNFTLSETSSGNFKVPALYLGTGIAASQVGVTQNLSASFDNGQVPSLYRPQDGNRRPYSSQYNLTIEEKLPQNFALTVSYVGTKGTHLPSDLDPINVLNPNSATAQGLGSDVAVSYNAAGGPAVFAKHGVAVPYVGWQTQLSACAPTLGQALLPFPQFCGPLQGLNEFHATSSYNSFQGRLEKRFNKGLYALSSLTLAKLMTDASDSTQATNDNSGGNQGNNGSFSPFDRSGRRYAVAPDNVPVTFQLSLVYNLPVGRGERFLNKSGFMNTLLGGFQVSPLYRYEYGTPFSFFSSVCPAAYNTGGLSSNGGIYRQFCVPAVVNTGAAFLQGRNSFNPQSNGGKLFNLAAFENNFTSLTATGTGSAVSTLYGPSFKNLDMAFTKNTALGEHINFKFSANFFNAFNSHYFINSQGGNFGGPGVAFVTDVAASGNSFGSWNGNVSSPRTIQFAGRIEF